MATLLPLLLGATALVYRGPGACDGGCWQGAAAAATRAGLTVRYVGPTATDPALFHDAAVWLQPGGESWTVDGAMTAGLKGRLQAFVAGGGGYVGFCAGGFFGSRVFHTVDNDGRPRDLAGLGFFAGESYLYDRDESPRILSVDWSGQGRYLYWEGGPRFVLPAGGRDHVVAAYPGGQPAVVETRYGQGRVVVTGPHPEAPMAWRDGLDDPDGDDVALAADLVRWAAFGGGRLKKSQ